MMDKRQRIAIQRALACDAIGKLNAASQYFSAEDGAVAGTDGDFSEWESKVQEFVRWLWEESPIA